MGYFEKFIDFLTKIVIALACICLSFVVLIITLNVIGRKLNMPLISTYDLAILGSAVSGSLAIAYTTRRKGHVYLDVFINMMKPKAKKFMALFSEIVFFITFVLLTWQSYVVMLERFSSENTETLHVPYFPFRLIWLFSMVLCTLISLFNIIKSLKGDEK